jgi:hypothetical protein
LSVRSPSDPGSHSEARESPVSSSRIRTPINAGEDPGHEAGRQDLRDLRGRAQALPGGAGWGGSVPRGDGGQRHARAATPAEDSAPFRWPGPDARRAVRGRALPLLALGTDLALDAGRGPRAGQAGGLRSGGFLRGDQGPGLSLRPYLQKPSLPFSYSATTWQTPPHYRWPRLIYKFTPLLCKSASL